MRDTMGIIYTGDNDVNLKELTRSRSVAAIPFGGRYRIIDFILSNMVNSGIRNVGIITRNNYHSLMDHLDAGRHWDLDRKRDGLFILPPFVSRGNTGWYKGTADALHNVMSYIRRSTQKYVIVSAGYMVCNMTYDDVLEFHKDNKADITVIYKDDVKARQEELTGHTLIKTDSNDRVWDMEVTPACPSSTKIFMDMFLMEKDLLEFLVEECTARAQYDFVRDILIKKMNILKIVGFPFKGHLAKIDNISSYYKHNMELLDQDVSNEIFHRAGPVYTKVKDEVPAKYSKTASAENSYVADGCVIEGRIENSILFRGVHIAEGAVVKNSILMQNVEIQEKVTIENVILDKEVIIRRGKRLIGQDSYPVVIAKKAVI